MSMETIAGDEVREPSTFHTLWKLPALPLTERFGPYDPALPLAFDQELVISVETGHVQMKNQLDPRVLYTDAEYSFRTGASGKSRSGVMFFLQFLGRMLGDETPSSVVDVGGNDLFVARHLAAPGRHLTVIDPICAAVDGQVIDGIKVFGRFIEQMDLAREVAPPDLVVCRHTLEHVARPREVIQQWFRQCAPKCLYVIEVPCFDNLVEAHRFDAVFHQHYHYFDLASFRHLLWECGGEYLGHAVNHQGSCGGALLVAFRRALHTQPKPVVNVAEKIRRVERRITLYRQQMGIMGELLAELPKPAYGYGASLMLATLGYHLRTDFSSLDCVLDDEPTRDGATYQNIPVTVKHTAKVKPAPNSSYLITSLENTRPIFRRIVELNPRRILVPLLT